jgi:hypothetical protein
MGGSNIDPTSLLSSRNFAALSVVDTQRLLNASSRAEASSEAASQDWVEWVESVCLDDLS